jgi:hypothetical protein
MVAERPDLGVEWMVGSGVGHRKTAVFKKLDKNTLRLSP